MANETEPIEIGEVPKEIKEAIEAGSFVKVWIVRTTGKIFARAFTTVKASKEDKLKTAKKSLANWEGKLSGANERLSKLNSVDASVVNVDRKVKAVRKEIKTATDKVAHFRNKIAKMG